MTLLPWLLLFLSLGAIIFDLHVTTHGAIAAAGGAGLVVAIGWLLFLSAPTWVALLVSTALLVLFFTGGRWIYRRWRALLRRAAQDPVVGRVARVVIPLQPDGWVKIDGVYWRATSPTSSVAPDEEVLVLGRHGLTLDVVALLPGEAAQIKRSGSG
jgi:membrane-bound ClpP family serine protease